jgi:hypothetical protein
MTRRRIYDEFLPPDPKKPKNLLAIQTRILGADGLPIDITQPSDQEVRDYTEYVRSWLVKAFKRALLQSVYLTRILVFLLIYQGTMLGLVARGGEKFWSQKSIKSQVQITLKD